ncbi:MAG: hypothetical protein M0R46_06925 [Candidatus Muirbacterium halophilum]|nr:hypothetical protein [Candidatus Muirbacterium halophilum]
MKKINEEIDLRSNKGIPDNFMSDIEDQAEKNLNISIDDDSKARSLSEELNRLDQICNRIISTDEDGNILSRKNINQRYRFLEDLAEKVVREKYGNLLDASILPIVLDINYVKHGQVANNIDLAVIPKFAKKPTPIDIKKSKERDDERNKDRDEGIEEKKIYDKNNEYNESVRIIETDINAAIDKKKLLNMITQAAGKTTKNIIQVSDLVENELKKEFGKNAEELLKNWIEISNIADKLDWTIPLDIKSNLMANIPQGFAGGVDVLWESLSGNEYNINLLLEKEATKVVIRAVGVDFPMLLHETIKGIYLYLQSGAIKQDKKTAQLIKAATSSFSDESQDFRYGPATLQMLITFVNKFPIVKKYSNMETMLFTMLSLDKERAEEEAKSSKEYKEYLTQKAKMALTDKNFLIIMKSMFSTFDKTEINGKIKFTINEKRFEESIAKIAIGKLITYIANDIAEYEKELAEWEAEEFSRKEYELYQQNLNKPNDEIDPDIKKLFNKDDDYANMTQAEINDLIDDALDNKDYDLVEKLAVYLKEGAEIYLRELENINENKK